VPNETIIDRRIFTKRWKRLIKEGLGIDKDMYLLKHAFSTEISKVSQQMAADFNSHVDRKMVEQHYDLLSNEKKREERKNVHVNFVSGLKRRSIQ